MAITRVGLEAKQLGPELMPLRYACVSGCTSMPACTFHFLTSLSCELFNRRERVCVSLFRGGGRGRRERKKESQVAIFRFPPQMRATARTESAQTQKPRTYGVSNFGGKNSVLRHSCCLLGRALISRYKWNMEARSGTWTWLCDMGCSVPNSCLNTGPDACSDYNKSHTHVHTCPYTQQQ